MNKLCVEKAPASEVTSSNTLTVSSHSCNSSSLHAGGLGVPLQKEGAFPVTQNRALQLLYDLRYLSLVLTTKGEEGKSGRSKPDPRCRVLPAGLPDSELQGFTEAVCVQYTF